MSDVTYLQEAWPGLDREENRKIVEMHHQQDCRFEGRD